VGDSETIVVDSDFRLFHFGCGCAALDPSWWKFFRNPLPALPAVGSNVLISFR